MITGGGYLIYISNGFLNGWSIQLDMALIFFWLYLIHLNVMWIPIQFIYRYTFICLSETYVQLGARETVMKLGLLICIGNFRPQKRARAKRLNTATAACASVWAVVGLAMTYIYSHSYEGFEAEGRHVLALNKWEVAQGTLIVGSNLVGISVSTIGYCASDQ